MYRCARVVGRRLWCSRLISVIVIILVQNVSFIISSWNLQFILLFCILKHEYCVRKVHFNLWCVDWRSEAVFPRSCTVKVWIVGLFRSRTRWRWQEGTVQIKLYLLIMSEKIFCLSGKDTHTIWSIYRLIKVGCASVIDICHFGRRLILFIWKVELSWYRGNKSKKYWDLLYTVFSINMFYSHNIMCTLNMSVTDNFPYKL